LIILFGVGCDEILFDCEKFLARVGWSRKELASRTGFKESAVGNWCTCSSTPNYATLAKLASLGMTAQEMFGEKVGNLLVENSSSTDSQSKLKLTDEDLSWAFLRAAQILGGKKK
jgi:transcriptional regulator with XRE-family HTH domain